MGAMHDLDSRRVIRIALLDLYEGVANEGMRCLRALMQEWSELHQIPVSVTEFDVRLQQDLPGLDFDVYISSGGPGSPLASDQAPWEDRYFKWIQEIENYNQSGLGAPKHVLFICHSFQLACRFFWCRQCLQAKIDCLWYFPDTYAGIRIIRAGICGFIGSLLRGR